MTVGPHEKRMLITGLHTVADIYCFACEVRALFCVRGKKDSSRIHIACVAWRERSHPVLSLTDTIACDALAAMGLHARTVIQTDAARLEVRGGVRGEPKVQGARTMSVFLERKRTFIQSSVIHATTHASVNVFGFRFSLHGKQTNGF